ncbi:MAG: OadG family transporter subunit [Caldilineales bacterium]|nr:OadG family transporter subunit [Caldilineales bacterium]MDW8319245.1 OadG family transporter subunit [Anaerolineae bacterium]
MSETFAQGLGIALVGMGLVFAALALLWALMTALGRLGRPRRRALRPFHEAQRADAAAKEPAALPTPQEMAAIATALWLLRQEEEAEASFRPPLPPELTRWVAVGYSRSLRPWQPPRAR